MSIRAWIGTRLLFPHLKPSTMWIHRNKLITAEATDEVWHTLEEKKRWLKCFDFPLNPPVAAARWQS